jgi:hypothetical protein
LRATRAAVQRAVSGAAALRQPYAAAPQQAMHVMGSIAAVRAHSLGTGGAG